MHATPPSHTYAHPIPQADLLPQAAPHRRVRSHGPCHVHEVPRGLWHADFHRCPRVALPGLPFRAEPGCDQLLTLPEVFDVPVWLHVLRFGRLREEKESLQKGPPVPIPFAKGMASGKLQRTPKCGAGRAAVRLARTAWNSNRHPPAGLRRCGWQPRPFEVATDMVGGLQEHPSGLSVQDMVQEGSAGPQVALRKSVRRTSGRPCGDGVDVRDSVS
mmetsp:Transcript_52430/g.170218  ORF Transcript_52430/g.170218 Transcript_52430/m.170218 type:complete len:216 (-) Transcript_52430:1297-1944(-)